MINEINSPSTKSTREIREREKGEGSRSTVVLGGGAGGRHQVRRCRFAHGQQWSVKRSSTVMYGDAVQWQRWSRWRLPVAGCAPSSDRTRVLLGGETRLQVNLIQWAVGPHLLLLRSATRAHQPLMGWAPLSGRESRPKWPLGHIDGRST
jgi:hypothetical protein